MFHKNSKQISANKYRLGFTKLWYQNNVIIKLNKLYTYNFFNIYFITVFVESFFFYFYKMSKRFFCFQSTNKKQKYYYLLKKLKNYFILRKLKKKYLFYKQLLCKRRKRVNYLKGRG